MSTLLGKYFIISNPFLTNDDKFWYNLNLVDEVYLSLGVN
jgi:hypothetical protein